MKLSIGIVGLPNVGKSTLFNALTLNNVPSENYPFCTIDPNVGVVPVYDDRLNQLAKIEDPEKIVPAIIEFVDIAGIIKGAHQGEGLGNKFLSHIREVDAIVQVVRNFQNKDIIHVNNKIDPKDDIKTINMELILKDIEAVEDKLNKVTKEYKAKPDKKYIIEWVEGLLKHLGDGELAVKYKSPEDIEIKEIRRNMFLLTDKPFIFLVNTENTSEDLEKVKSDLDLKSDDNVMLMDVKIEQEIFMLDEPERAEYLKELGISEPGLHKLTRLAYEVLGLISFFTSGKKEVKAWTIKKNDNIREAAAAIHNDFKEKFIAAEIVDWKAFVENGGWEGSKRKGSVRLEGKEYITKDGDVVIFKHGA